MIPFFLIPTALIWSSGILKDTIVMGAIGVLLYTFYNVCSLKRNVLINLFITYISLLFLLLFRPVLLFVYTPCIVIWGLIYALKNIVSLQKKIILITTVLIFAFSFGYLISGNVLDSKPKYQIENFYTVFPPSILRRGCKTGKISAWTKAISTTNIVNGCD